MPPRPDNAPPPTSPPDPRSVERITSWNDFDVAHRSGDFLSVRDDYRRRLFVYDANHDPEHFDQPLFALPIETDEDGFLAAVEAFNVGKRNGYDAGRRAGAREVEERVRYVADLFGADTIAAAIRTLRTDGERF